MQAIMVNYSIQRVAPLLLGVVCARTGHQLHVVVVPAYCRVGG